MIRRSIVVAFLTGVVLCSAVHAADSVTVPPDTLSSVKNESASDTVGTVVDTALAGSPEASADDMSGDQHETAVQSEDRESRQKIRLIKRNYDYKRQVFFALGMMAFIAIMLSSSQSWNPK